MSLLVALVATPALLGTQEAIRQSQQKERREEHRARRCNLIARCIRSSIRCVEINGRPLVLRDGEVSFSLPLFQLDEIDTTPDIYRHRVK
jgi:hypothetical protein